VHISGLPKQTAKASTQVTLSQYSNSVAGGSVIIIPGIGSGDVGIVISHVSIKVTIEKIPGQTGESDNTFQIYDIKLIPPIPMVISVIGKGTLSITITQ